MKKIAITGQIGTGKSVLLNQFKFLGYKTYSSDQMVKDLYAKDKHVINEIRKLNPNLILDKKIRFESIDVYFSDFFHKNKVFNTPVIIMAGGLGLRLGQLTKNCPSQDLGQLKHN